jgi:thymidylate synthase
MDEVLVSICSRVLAQGEISAPRGANTKELLGVSFVLADPRARRITLTERGWREYLAVGELAWHLAGSDRVDELAYYAPKWSSFSDDGVHILGSCYGKVLFGRGASGRSQWESVIELLRTDPDSRRAVLSFGGPELANQGLVRRDLPCITSIQFLLRAGHLNCVTTMRSNDVIWGLCYDVFLVTMLHELLSVQLSVELGWYQHSAGSLHVYDYHMELTERIARASLTTSRPMPPMSDPQAIPTFLRAERALRLGDPSASELLSSLPLYWRELATPLVQLQQHRHAPA